MKPHKFLKFPLFSVEIVPKPLACEDMPFIPLGHWEILYPIPSSLINLKLFSKTWQLNIQRKPQTRLTGFELDREGPRRKNISIECVE